MNNKAYKIISVSILIMIVMGTVYSWSVFRISVENDFNLNATQSGIPYMSALFFYAISMMVTG
jgi:MFS transporter, OFA family, oxalate/formate antiporter